MKRRWNTYKSKFTRTLNAKRSETGMGLTQKELKAGLSIPAKLDTMCPHFARMESLFGEKRNVAVIGDNPSGTPPTNEAESETSSDEESCAGTDICSDDERDAPAAGSDGQRGVEREAGSGVEREAEPHAPHAAPFAGVRNDRRDDAFVGGADARTGSRNAGRAADHVAGGATDAGGSSENNRAIDGDEPEFRFDSYSPPPPPSTANRSSENVGDRVQAEFEPEALVMYNELGLSDEDLRDLQSRLVAEQNCVVPDHQQAALPHAARTNTKKQSQKRSSSKVSGSKKTSSKKKKTMHKRALIPTALTEGPSEDSE
ncbi:hypothetical protein PF008_g14403 [Phytophthora fragariae]|uniref:Uncharacterized protein n=1 Tax=Phytophthora fragariae TaxID=53985 RepID=A0A6G0RHK8_9STRA|nr:hypothetical protein PF008_g14403 [Phytophthora fragariae]